MYKEILTKEQLELLPLLNKFSKEYYLVGGTAISLQIGHRRSVDFDLFTKGKIKRKIIKNVVESMGYKTSNIILEDFDQMHFVVNGVTFTFFSFEYDIEPEFQLEKINIPSLLSLAAMKVNELGGRTKWKDYVDLYFIFKNNYTFDKVVNMAKEIWDNSFNDKLLKEQLSYFEDIDYSEEIEYMGEEVSKDEIKTFLVNVATEKF